MMLEISKVKRGFGLEPCRAIFMTIMFIILVTSNISLAENVRQLTFASPDEAVSVLVKALKLNDVKALKTIFGPGSQDLINSNDPVADQSGRAKFLKLFEEKNYLEQAANKVVKEILVEAGGEGGVISMDAQGNIAMPFNTEGMYRASIDTDGKLSVAIYNDE